MTTAVVVGSGPNGLAAALTLARAGVSVRVIEAAEEIGGGTRSVVRDGLVFDECSGFHPFATASPFAREFSLDVTWRQAPTVLAHPLDSGGAHLTRSVEATASSLGADGASWQRLFGPVVERFDTISEEFLQPVVHLPRHPFHLARFGMYAAQPATLLARRWRGDAARGLFGGIAAHAFTRLDTPFSAAVGVALGAASHAYGWPVAQGGSAAIAAAMVARGRDLGVSFETGRLVTSIDEVPADIVMLDTAPGAAASILGSRLPGRVARAYWRYRHGPAAFKVDFAVEGGVPWAYGPGREAAVLHLGGTIEQVAAAEADTNAGRMPERPFVLVGQQWLADPTRSRGDVHPLYAYAHVPAGFTGDATSAIVEQIERFAPGFRERVVATHVTSTRELSRKNPNYVGGDIATGLSNVRQVFFRPRPALDPYATGVPGVFLCSAATPPGAGAHGMCGWLAAKAALRRLPQSADSGLPRRGRLA